MPDTSPTAAIGVIKVQLLGKTIELTADEARRLHAFLAELFKQELPPAVAPSLPPQIQPNYLWIAPIIIPANPQWTPGWTSPYIGDPIWPHVPSVCLVQTDLADGIEHHVPAHTITSGFAGTNVCSGGQMAGLRYLHVSL